MHGDLLSIGVLRLVSFRALESRLDNCYLVRRQESLMGRWDTCTFVSNLSALTCVCRDRQTDSQSDRQTDKQRQGQTDRQTDRR